MNSGGYERRFDYRVEVKRRRNRLTAHSATGALLAETERALIVDEQDHGLVFYFPREDIRLDLLEPMPDKITQCPWKGQANYWQLKEKPGEPVAWAYDTPFPEVAQITGHIAFYQNVATVSIGVAAVMQQNISA